MDWGKPHTGTQDGDYKAETVALQAAQVLSVGHTGTTVSGDHLNGTETCAACIVRLSPVRKSTNDPNQRDSMIRAVHNIRRGYGYHVKQSDHSGGNTCADVIAKATG